jgi:hypothetical protein
MAPAGALTVHLILCTGSARALVSILGSELAGPMPHRPLSQIKRIESRLLRPQGLWRINDGS